MVDIVMHENVGGQGAALIWMLRCEFRMRFHFNDYGLIDIGSN